MCQLMFCSSESYIYRAVVCLLVPEIKLKKEQDVSNKEEAYLSAVIHQFR